MEIEEKIKKEELTKYGYGNIKNLLVSVEEGTINFTDAYPKIKDIVCWIVDNSYTTGYDSGNQDGCERGKDIGYSRGWDDGYEEGSDNG